MDSASVANGGGKPTEDVNHTLKRSAEAIDDAQPETKRSNTEDASTKKDVPANEGEAESKKDEAKPLNIFAAAVSKVDSKDGGNLFAFGQKPTGFGASATSSWGASSSGGFGGGFKSSAFGGGFTSVQGDNSASSLFGGTGSTTTTTPSTFGSGSSSTFGIGSTTTSEGSTTPKLFADIKPLFASAEPLAAEKARGELTSKKAKSVFENLAAPKSGEEEEEKVFTLDNCQLFLLTKTKTAVKDKDGKEVDQESVSWQERGKGKLTVNDAADASRSRLVMRQDTTKVLYLNAPVWHGLNCQIKSMKNLSFSAVNYASAIKAGEERKAEVFLIRGFGGDKKRELEIKELFGLLQSRVENLAPTATPPTTTTTPPPTIPTTPTPTTSSSPTPTTTATPPTTTTATPASDDSVTDSKTTTTATTPTPTPTPTTTTPAATSTSTSTKSHGNTNTNLNR